SVASVWDGENKQPLSMTGLSWYSGAAQGIRRPPGNPELPLASHHHFLRVDVYFDASRVEPTLHGLGLGGLNISIAS
ncbi:Hypothetical protein FKW44_019412, partial [Caligus rogercresseyi]